MTRLFAFFVLIAALSACGSGGDGSGSAAGLGDKGGFQINACESLGLKISSGTTCEVAGELDSPVARVTVTDNSGEPFVCSGVIVGPALVLTAAHCFMTGALHVEVSTDRGVYTMLKYTVHPNISFDPTGSYIFNDVALVETTGTLAARTIPLLFIRPPAIGEEGILAGYGGTEDAEPREMRVGNTYLQNVTPNHIFVVEGGDNSAPCQGDSGGGLFVMHNGILSLAGLVSQNDPANVDRTCGVGGAALYTNIQSPEVLSFILNEYPQVGLN